MEYTEDTTAMLELIPSPAFFVKDGIITDANTAACQRQVPVGGPLRPMLVTGFEEYDSFPGGCLYLTLRICGVPCSASVTQVSGQQLFVLEQDADQAELQSMALAAQALRAPLSNVMTIADRLFPLTCFDDAPEAQEQIARINRGMYQMLRIVCNMSDAYRYSADNSLRTELRDVSALIREIFTGSIPLVEHTGVTLRYTGPTETIFSLVDTEKLERAIGNILSNAIKFASGGSAIHARLTHRGRLLYLTVQDDGPGIPEQQRASVYRRYQRQPGIEDGRYGIGLGMVLIRSAAAAHGGTVLIEHGSDFGLRLTMTLPIRQHTDAAVRSPMLLVDYAGERDHRLLELSDCLPAELYSMESLN